MGHQTHFQVSLDWNSWNGWIPLTNSSVYRCAMILIRKLERAVGLKTLKTPRAGTRPAPITRNCAALVGPVSSPGEFFNGLSGGHSGNQSEAIGRKSYIFPSSNSRFYVYQVLRGFNGSTL